MWPYVLSALYIIADLCLARPCIYCPDQTKVHLASKFGLIGMGVVINYSDSLSLSLKK